MNIMRVVLVILVIIAAVCICVHLFTKEKSSENGVPPDDIYPLF